MAYSSLSSILLIVPGLPQSAVNGSGYTETSNVIAQHIRRADALIDSKISRRYPVPISPTPPLLGSISEDIVVYYTYRSFYTQDNHNRTEYFEEAKDIAIGMLNEIRDGQIDLVNTLGSLISERSTTAAGIMDSTNKNYQPFFDVDNEFDWKFDNDLLDAIKDER